MRLMRPLMIALAITVMSAACSMPKLVVLHDPLSPDEHVRLGVAYRDQGKHDLARDQFRAAVERDKKHGKAWALLGEAAFFLEEFDEAEKAYGRAIALDEENGDLYNNLAWVLVSRGERLDEARKLVNKAIKITPAHRPYYLDTLGVILLNEGRTGEAIPVLEESVRTIPQEQRSFLAEAWLHLAEAYKIAGDAVKEKEARRMAEKLRQPEGN